MAELHRVYVSYLGITGCVRETISAASNTLMAVLALLVILILGGFVVASYYGLWMGLFQPLREHWRTAPHDERRKLVVETVGCTVFVAVLLSLSIAEPFGPDSIIFVFGVVGILLFIALHLIVIGEIRRDHRNTRRKGSRQAL